MRIGRILVLAVLLVAGCAAGLARQDAARPVSIAPSGPYAVGRAQQQWVDRSRTDRLAPLGGTPRVLSAWLWYPAAPGGGGRPSSYAPGAWAALHRYGWAQTSFDRIRTGTRDDAPVAPGSFPIVVLLPGLGLAAPQYQALASRLAARGYLVVGVTPTYSASLTVIADRAVRSSAAGRPATLDGPRGDDLVAVWAADARFAAAQASIRLAGHVDPARIVYAGHGFGGAAALEACRTDRLCRGAADLDGTPYGPVAAAGLDRPLLLLGGLLDDATRQMFTASGGPRWAYTISGVRQLGFTDYAAYRLAAPLRRALPVGRPDTQRIAAAYLTSFLDVATHGAAWTMPDQAGVRAAEIPGR